MRVSAKGRYALAAMTHLGEHDEDGCIPIIQIAEKLDISKIYLEQVFSLLKRSDLVVSIKGAQGGYQLKKSANDITIYEIMQATEAAIFEETKETVQEKAPGLDDAMNQVIFTPLDEAIEQSLKAISLQQLIEHYKTSRPDGGLMYFI